MRINNYYNLIKIQLTTLLRLTSSYSLSTVGFCRKSSDFNGTPGPISILGKLVSGLIAIDGSSEKL